MKSRPHLLILGGTGEAYALAQAAQTDPVLTGLRVTTSLAGRTKAPRPPQGALRRGGFGGANGFAATLAAEEITLVVDATHPFAQTMGRTAATVCAAQGVPLLRFERPPWRARAGDRWIIADDWPQALAEARRRRVHRLFLAVGRNGLPAFAHRLDFHFVIRAVDDPRQRPELARAFPGAPVILGRGPFSAAADQALMEAHGVQGVMCKNAGGAAGAGKLAAARALGLPVFLRARPARPKLESAEDLNGALAWIRAHVWKKG